LDARRATANHTNLGSDLQDFDGATEVKPEINLPTGITVPDRSGGEEIEITRESVALVPNLLAIGKGAGSSEQRQGRTAVGWER
jgi:hypothetical protein